MALRANSSYDDPLWRDLELLPHFVSSTVDFSGEAVTVGAEDELASSDREKFKEVLRKFIPWKKGPFRLFDTEIASEWRSDWKWDRIRDHIEISGKRICDIGCHNGYYMFRMLAEQPKLVVGIEPFARHEANFHLIQRFVQDSRLHFERMGVEDFGIFDGYFDTVFCLGILYHHTDPISILRRIHRGLAAGGQVVIDCQGIPDTRSVCLVPQGRYAGARGVWFLPSKPCLVNWLRRANFSHVNCVYEAPLAVEEQRSTEWAPIKSLQDFLDPNDKTLTIEGYPAPWRFYLVATK